MKKLHLLASAVGLMALSLTSCQRTQYTTFQKSSTPAVEHVAKAKAPQAEVVAPVEVAPVSEEVVAPSLVEAAKPVETAAKVEAPVAVASTKTGVVANKRAAKLMNKIAFKKDEQGHVNVVAQAGKKLTAVEKLVVKKVNKQILKAEKAQAKGKKPFSDWNKYLRIGVIILAAALILSIISAAAVWSSGLWILISLAWVAGWILTIYGLGLELAWW
ncbi:hypothetical protein [Siphonobacter sp. SORGH_AS_1065]|uniref:hypothetical protein n=1 Tax=Siphonobacter sp. SORGH_AS_1065 TaxID=3041795 RepID=UPI00277FB676|nr:hypothetical protein [Siphonobacter sp. SORGH_AS_1065]MDQ1088142.1 glucose/arabinose dehydrogenase [Siphonobacter sp. SORGH_AS_1065]